MLKVAFIDDGIMKGVEGLPSNSIKLEVRNKEVTEVQDRNNLFYLSHGTMCYWIFQEYANNTSFELYDVKIMEPEVGKTSINNLLVALKYCLTKQIDIICMSIGSTSFYDDVLDEVLKKLHDSGSIMVAAANNMGYLTYPAFSKWVIGVKCDYSKKLKFKEYYYSDNDISNIEIISHCSFEAVENKKGIKLDRYNSFSAPYIAALIYNMLFSGICKNEIRHNLVSNAIKDEPRIKLFNSYEFQKKFCNQWYSELDVPVINIPKEIGVSEEWFKLVHKIFKREGFQSAGMGEDVKGETSYLLNHSRIRRNIDDTEEQLLLLLYNVTNADILITSVGKNNTCIDLTAVANKEDIIDDNSIMIMEPEAFVNEIIQKY